MTEKEFKEDVIETMRRAHFMDYAFIHGEDYVKKHRVWIDWEFERKLKRMTEAEWERVTKAYIEALKGDEKRNEGDEK